MKIWVIGRGVPTKKNKMKGSFELEQAQMLARHGHEVIYLAIEMSVRRWMDVGSTEKFINGVRSIELCAPINRLLPEIINSKIKIKIRKYFYNKILRQYGRPDVIHVHYPSLHPFGPFKAFQDNDTKLVCTEHWSKVQNKTLKRENQIYLQDCVKYYDHLICVGEPLVKSIRELTGTKRPISVLPNIVSKEFSFSEDHCVTKGRKFRFIGVGRLVKLKRFDLMIKAFIDAFKGNDKVKLDIIGGGDEYTQLKKLIQLNQAEDQVSLLGIMNRKEVAAYYKKCNALLVSSNLETFGIPIIEAMATGLPVVTTDAMGFPSLFHKEHGYIVPADDEKAFAKAMRSLYDNYEGFNSKKISEYARAMFGEEVIYKKLLSIYSADKKL